MQSDSTLSPKVWTLVNGSEHLVEELSRVLPVSPTLCRILVNRGIHTSAQAEQFLQPNLCDLHDPSLFDGMDWAVDRTRRAIDAGEKIMVHGDYDVDGITSTSLLVRVLRILNADVSWYIPHRQREGYDIGIPAVDEALNRGVKLIITVDCGTSAVDAVAHARESGIDVIVTDHHEVGARIAPANVVINPHKPDCPYPFKHLAGVGVAFKFAEALIRECGYDVSVYRRRFCDLAAMGTVADVVPLLGENRTIVKFGLEELPRTGKKGLRALLQVAGLSSGKITSHTLAFGLGPRLNAAGRIDDAAVALKLLLTVDEAEAVALSQELDRRNRERQVEQERITGEATEYIIMKGLDETSKVLVLSSKGWHPGIIGIVASKITDRYSRPSILVAIDETGQAGVGSARSIEGFDVFEALTQCSHLLERFGGHRRAAGLSIITDKLEDFCAEINRIADEILTESDLKPQLEVDAEIEIECATMDFAHELNLLEPYGHGNPQPLFMSRRVLILQKTKMGAGGSHLRLRLGTPSGRPVECVAFGWGDKAEAFRIGSLLDLCYNIQINQFNGNTSVQAVLRDARPSEAMITEPTPLGEMA